MIITMKQQQLLFILFKRQCMFWLLLSTLLECTSTYSIRSSNGCLYYNVDMQKGESETEWRARRELSGPPDEPSLVSVKC